VVWMGIPRARGQDQSRTSAIDYRCKVAFQALAGIRMSGEKRIGVGDTGLAGEVAARGFRVVIGEQLRQSAIRVSEEELLRTRHPEK
jgi:hypothetical protein